MSILRYCARSIMALVAGAADVGSASESDKARLNDRGPRHRSRVCTRSSMVWKRVEKRLNSPELDTVADHGAAQVIVRPQIVVAGHYSVGPTINCCCQYRVVLWVAATGWNCLQHNHLRSGAHLAVQFLRLLLIDRLAQPRALPHFFVLIQQWLARDQLELTRLPCGQNRHRNRAAQQDAYPNVGVDDDAQHGDQ